jgi:hypothetical protein
LIYQEVNARRTNIIGRRGLCSRDVVGAHSPRPTEHRSGLVARPTSAFVPVGRRTGLDRPTTNETKQGCRPDTLPFSGRIVERYSDDDRMEGAE